jgi:hypothetical protein
MRGILPRVARSLRSNEARCGADRCGVVAVFARMSVSLVLPPDEIDLPQGNAVVRRIRVVHLSEGASAMATTTRPDPDSGNELEDEPIPAMQQLLDNPFLLLFIGIAMPTVLYVIWGVMEIVGIPIAK